MWKPGASCVPASLYSRKDNRRWLTISSTNAVNKDDEPRINEEIRASQVLLIDDRGNKLGIVPIAEALRFSDEKDLDLVEVAPQANPPVCRILDYGKYRFQQQKRDKDAKKKQKNQAVKEMKMRPKIDQHDYDFKVRAIKNFLSEGHRVKVSIFFRGREMAFLDRGREVLNRVMTDIASLGKVETEPKMEGSYMRMMVSPISGQSPTVKPSDKNRDKPRSPRENKEAKEAQDEKQ